MESFSAVILAGGRSTRMGRDKRLLVVGGQTLLERQIETARKAGATEVFVSVVEELGFPVPACQVIADRFKGCGPLAGIEAGLAFCAHSRLLVMAVDMPQLSAEFLGWLLAESSGDAGVVPCENGAVHPLSAVYPKRSHFISEDLLSRGTFKARSFVHACEKAGIARRLAVPERFSGATANWNRPEEAAL